MKRNSKLQRTGKLICLGLIAIALLFAGCENGLLDYSAKAAKTPDEPASGGAANGNITIFIGTSEEAVAAAAAAAGGGDARTLTPAVIDDLDDFDTVNLSFQKVDPGNSNAPIGDPLEYGNVSGTFNEQIPVGFYVITAMAYNDIGGTDYVAARGVATMNVVGAPQNETDNKATIVLETGIITEGTGDKNGVLEYNLSSAVSVSSPSYSLKVFQLNVSSALHTLTGASGSIVLAPAFYTLEVEASSGTKVAKWNEVVFIYSGQKTLANYTFAENRYAEDTRNLTGTASITGTNKIGETLTANTGGITLVGTIPGGTWHYQWKADGSDVGTDSATYVIRGEDVTKEISCVITYDRVPSARSITATGQVVPYTVNVAMSGNGVGDSIAASPDTGNAGASVTLTVNIANTHAINRVNSFGGVTALIAAIPSAGNGQTRSYTIAGADAVNGIITITANFEHSALTGVDIAFAGSSVTKTYGDAPFTYALTETGAGSGAITYSSGTPGVATVDNTGLVTIVANGTSVITATKAANGDYAEATASYTLTVNPKEITVINVSAENKVYNRSTAASINNSTAALSGLVTGDESYVTLQTSGATAAFADWNVGDGKTVTFVGYTITGARAGRYTLTQPANGSANITPKPLTIGNPTLTTTKTYNRSTDAAVTPASLVGVETGDTVGVTAKADYNSMNTDASTITVVYTLTGSDLGNYTKPVNYGPVSGTITPLKLTAAAPSFTANKAYDGDTATNTVTPGALTNLISPDAVTLNIASSTYANANVANGITITVVYSITGASAANYSAPDNYTTTGNITKAPGAPVSGAPTLNDQTATTITVNAVTVNGNALQNAQQTVQYGISTSSSAEPGSWQTSTTFINLTPNTTYYVSARTAESANYLAGALSRSAGITTPNPGAGIGFTIQNPDTGAVVGSVVSGGGTTIPATGSLTVSITGTVPANWASITWNVRGDEITSASNQNSLTIHGIDYPVGQHQILVMVINSLGVPSTSELYFIVEN
uniref:Uncharacterized protein n=1 Tax=uncultured bacterium contig00140 TaxID=1181583 RepID=A0A806KKL3_9BACT|nr:hypothetical protein [uncultured bacterium contig00140]